MKPGMLCLLLLAGCSEYWKSANFQIYALTWSCLSPEGCERTDQVVLIDRMTVRDNSPLVDFASSDNPNFAELAETYDDGSLPAGCSWLYSVVLFAHELEPARLCRTPEDREHLELELSIPNRDLATHSQWLVEGRAIGP